MENSKFIQAKELESRLNALIVCKNYIESFLNCKELLINFNLEIISCSIGENYKSISPFKVLQNYASLTKEDKNSILDAVDARIQEIKSEFEKL